MKRWVSILALIFMVGLIPVCNNASAGIDDFTSAVIVDKNNKIVGKLFDYQTILVKVSSTWSIINFTYAGFVQNDPDILYDGDGCTGNRYIGVSGALPDFAYFKADAVQPDAQFASKGTLVTAQRPYLFVTIRSAFSSSVCHQLSPASTQVGRIVSTTANYTPPFNVK